MVMAERGISAEEAVHVVHHEWQQRNVKLAGVAARLVMDRRDGHGEFLAR
jgi:hypothetical protein